MWTKDERGYISYKEYDLASGNVTQSIEDVDDTQLTVPSGWSTPADGGKHLVTDFEYDNLDRLTQTLGSGARCGRHDCPHGLVDRL